MFISAIFAVLKFENINELYVWETGDRASIF